MSKITTIAGVNDGNVPIEKRKHPPGGRGIKISAMESARRAKEGRLDPAIIGWTRRVLVKAGKPTTHLAQAKAIYDAFKERVMYVNDPSNSEFIPRARDTLCLQDEHGGLCFLAEDCEGLVAAYGACVMSVGINYELVLQCFDDSGVPVHVHGAVQDFESKKWVNVELSSPQGTNGIDIPFGKHLIARSEIRVNPMRDTTVNIPGSDLGLADFVGLGGVPMTFGPDTGVLGAASATEKPAFVAMTLGDASISDWLKQTFGQAAAERLAMAVSELDRSIIGLKYANKTLLETRATLRGENNVFDFEPLSTDPQNPGASPYTSFESFPTMGGTWTKSMQDGTTWLLSIVDTVSKIGHEALNGERKTIMDITGQITDVFIEAKSTDLFKLLPFSAKGVDGTFLGLFDPQGNLKMQVDQYVGSPPHAPRTATEITLQGSNSKNGTIGLAPLAIVAIVVAGALATIAMSVAAYFIIAKLCSMLKVYIEETTHRDILKEQLSCIREGKCTPEQITAMTKADGEARVNLQKARTEETNADPFAKVTEAGASALKFLVIGGTIVGSLYLAKMALPTIQDMLTKHKKAEAA